jgi:pSer/pThr/pTyr-binding forkhead associated (FHA) protein
LQKDEANNPPQKAFMPKLVVLSEGFTGRTYELKTERTTVGRLDDNAFCVPEPSVSSHHCEILLKGAEVVVRDLNSTNGTFIGGQQITEAVLKPGQILRLGNLQMRLEGDQPPPAKKALDQTVILPQGVKLNELETAGPKPSNFADDTQFGKKKNRANLIFIIVGVVLGLLVAALLVYVFMKAGTLTSPNT